MERIILPELGEGIEQAVIACWHYGEGDQVEKDDDLVELVTDKATFNVSAEAKGILKQILVKEGDQAAIGETLAIIEPLSS